MKYQIIGWTNRKSGDFLVEESLTSEMKNAISDDIKMHHYLFNMDDHMNKDYCVPVLSNYRKVILNKEDFASLFLSSFDYLKNIDANIFLESGLLLDKDKKYPNGKKSLHERKDLFSKYKISKRLFGIINGFFLTKEFNHQNVFLFPVKMDETHHFWINDRLILFNDLVGEKIFGQILKLYSFKNKAEFINKINGIKKDNPEVYFGYSLKELDKYIDKEFVMLGFIKARAEDYLIDLDILIKKCNDYAERPYEFLKDL